MDDDDEFLYGSSAPVAPTTTTTPPPSTSAAPQPISLENAQAALNGLVSHLESQAENDASHIRTPSSTHDSGNDREQDDEEEEEVEEDESDDDVEIVMEAPSRSLDLRPNRPISSRVPSGGIPTGPKAQHQQQSTLTTEYTPISRDAPVPNSVLTQLAQSTRGPPPQQQQFGSVSQPPSPSQPHHQQQVVPQQFDQGAGPSDAQQQQVEDDGVDTSALPPVKAPSSHPSIDPSETGVYDGRSILEFDLNALTDKPWRRPGSDISDWFNYGFDEISWEAYCYRRRDLGDLAHVLKTNIINFSGMNEDQLTVLPPEVHTMVMTGANVAMNNAAQGMIGGGPGMMMDHMGMGPGGMVGPMGMDMNNMNMGGGMIPGMMQDGVVQGQPGGMGMNPADTGVGVGNAVGMMADGFAGGAQGGMMNMSMGDYSMQQEQNSMVQGMYPGMDVPQSVTPVSGGTGRGTPVPFSHRGARGAGSVPSRGTRGFAPRGRGRPYDGPPQAPVRPASPLPPGVPTGPRNANKYKDRDGNAPAVDGLDYGGGKDGGRRTPSGEPEERSSSRYSHDRKRRSSPGLDDLRSSKRR